MKWQDTIWALTFAVTLSVTGVRAQSQQSSQSAYPSSAPTPLNSNASGGYAKSPAPAARGVSPGYNSQPYDPAQVVPDTNTLSGAQMFGVGSLEHTHNVFDPSLSVSEQGAVTTGASAQSSTTAQTIINGTLNFSRSWSIYRLTTVYNGGETIGYNLGGSGIQGTQSSNQQFHEVGVTQQAEWDRWRLLLHDDFNASPGASFSGTGMGGPGLLAQLSSTMGSSLNSIGQAFIPSESIETGSAMRYRNTVLGQAEYSLSRRSAFTFSGSYGLLQFSNAGYISSRMVNAQAGYDYLLDPRNSIAVLGGYGKIDYAGSAGSTTDYLAALAFGRRITGRLAFQVSAGPQQIRSKGAAGNFQLWVVSVNSALTYDRRRSGASFNYARGLSAGSGVFLGAQSDTFSGTAHYRFTRFWTGTVNGGYALNKSLAPAGTPTTSTSNWFFGSSFGREVGQHARINFNYGLQRQINPAICPVASCGGTGFQQTFGITVNWHLRPSEL